MALPKIDMARPILTGGLFAVTDVSRQHPLQWAWGQRILEEHLNPRTRDSLAAAFIEIGEQIRDRWVSMLQMGEYKPPPPLSAWTLKARSDREGISDGFLADTGTFAESLGVVLRKSTRGAIAIGIEASGDPSSHTVYSPISNWDLINLLCNTGLEMYADDLSPDALAKLMAWRSLHFGGREGAEVDEATADEPYTDPETGKVTTLREYAKRGRGISGRAERRLRQTRKEVLGLKGRKPVLFIPPRPLMTNEVQEDLARAARELTAQYFGQRGIVIANALSGGHWGPALLMKTKAELAAIKPGW